jgi:hypothetical protein
MPKPNSKEFWDDVVAVARCLGPKTILKHIAVDFGISDVSISQFY